MRGRILQYNGNDGTGIVVADGQQHKFTIGNWKGETAPVVGKTVELTLADGQVQTVTLVSDEVLMREKTAELTSKLSGMVSSAGAPGGIGNVILSKFGKPMLIGWGVFVIAVLFLPAINAPMMGNLSLYKLAGMQATLGGGGGLKFLLILAILSPVLPFFWADKKAWLAMLLPLIAMLWGPLTAKRGFGAGASMGDILGMLGVGYYVALIAAVVVALGAFKKFTTS